MGAESKLLGASWWEAQQVNQWIDWNSFELEQNAYGWFFSVTGMTGLPYDAKVRVSCTVLELTRILICALNLQTTEEKRQATFKVLGDLNKHLASRASSSADSSSATSSANASVFVVGSAVTCADIVIACVLVNIYKHVR
mgnify:CR=1 FL=1